MKGKKIITISIIITILTIGIIYNFKKQDYLNNEKMIVKAMTETEYEDYITELNQSHTEYANYIETAKAQIASAITDMGVTTTKEATPETMSSNIRSIARNEYSLEDDILNEVWGGRVYTNGETTTTLKVTPGVYLLTLCGRNTNTLNTVSISGLTPIYTHNPTSNTRMYVFVATDIKTEINFYKNNSYESISYSLLEISDNPNYDYTKVLDFDNIITAPYVLQIPVAQTINLTAGKWLVLKPTGEISGRFPTSNNITTTGEILDITNVFRAGYFFNTAIVEADNNFTVTTEWGTSEYNSMEQPNVTIAIRLK